MGRWSCAFSVVLWVLSASTPTVVAEDDLPHVDPPKQKAVVKCQEAITKAGGKFLELALKKLDGCTSSALRCIELTPGDSTCLGKAQSTCNDGITSGIPVARTKLVEKIVATCGQQLSLSDLLASDGLGFGALVTSCKSELGTDICAGLPNLAECLGTQFERAAERLLSTQQPRAGEFITALSTVPLVFLQHYEGCGACSQFPSDSIGKAVAECGDTTAKAGREHAVATFKALQSCAAGVFACVQRKSTDVGCEDRERLACERGSGDGEALCLATAETKCARKSDAIACLATASAKCRAKWTKREAGCLRKASTGCAKIAADADACLAAAQSSCAASTDKIAARRASLVEHIGADCTNDGLIPYPTLELASALNLQALGDRCASLGFTPLEDLDDYVACLRTDHECLVGDLVSSVVPRHRELASATGIDDPTDTLLPDDTCGTVPAKEVTTETRSRAPFFGSITKFIRFVRRTKTGTSVGPTHGAAPAGSGSRTVRLFGAPRRFVYGRLTKIPFRYTVRRTRAPVSDEAPTLILTMQRDGAELEDHFEIPLDTPPDDVEVDDEIELVYENPAEVPACAFTIAFATRAANGVSEYTSLLQVEDPELPTPTPTTTPSAAPTPTGTASATSTPTALPSVTASPTSSATPTTTSTPSTTPTATVGGTASPTSTRTPTPTATSSPALAFLDIIQDLDQPGGVDGLAGATDVAVSPDGTSVYVAAYDDAGIGIFDRNPSTGLLSYLAVRRIGLVTPTSVVVSPDNANVYVSFFTQGAVARFTRDPATGLLTFKDSQDGMRCRTGNVNAVCQTSAECDTAPGNGECRTIMSQANTVIMSPDGTSLYVSGNTTLAWFARDPGTGQLTYQGNWYDGVDGVDGLQEAGHMAISADGLCLYVGGARGAGSTDNAVAVFKRNVATGALTFREAERAGGLPVMSRVAGVALSPVEDTLYVVSRTNSSVTAFTRDPTSCDLLDFGDVETNGLGGVKWMSLPLGAAITPDGLFQFVASGGDGGVAMFRRGNLPATLDYVTTRAYYEEEIPDPPVGVEVAVSPDGQSLYAIADKVLETYRIQP